MGIDPDLLACYVRGDCSLAEQRRVRDWVAASPANAQELTFWRTLWDRSARLRTDELPVGINSAHAAARIRARAGVLPHVGSRKAETGSTRYWPAAAAALAVAVGLGVALGALRQNARGPAAARREYATAAGQRLSVTLVDGTQVTLAPASRVRVAAAAREVELAGEAYFAVVHDGAHPFTVRAHGAVARDLGTAFDVRAYPDDAGARVAVAEGVVAVTTAGGCRAGMGAGDGDGKPCGTEARAGDVATVRDGRVAVGRGVDVASMTAWTQGELVFHDTPLHDALTQLGRWYDLEFIVTDSALAQRVVTATFTGQSLPEVLNAVGGAVNARIDRRGRLVSVSRRPSGQSMPAAGLVVPTVPRR